MDYSFGTDSAPSGGVSSTPAQPAGSITTAGDPGYTPDYTSLIYSDPGYMALKSAMDSSLSAFNSSMRGQVGQDVLASGYRIPLESGLVTNGVLEQAKKNPYSQAALALKGHTANIRNIQNSLAARGGFSSGELPYGLGNEGDRYNMQTLQNEATLANEIRGLLGQGTQLQSSWQAQLANALGAAAQNQLALHPQVSPTPGTTATYVKGSEYTVGNGQPIYQDANGNYYTADGQPFTPTGYGI